MSPLARCVILCATVSIFGCERDRPKAGVTASASVRVEEPPPRVLFIPDAVAPEAVPAPAAPPRPRGTGHCPPEMVDVQGSFCIDRLEATLYDKKTSNRLSPYYHPLPEVTRREYERWQRARADAKTEEGRRQPVPAPDEWALSARHFEPIAKVEPDATPNGYMSAEAAERACANAGKRLCSAEEWVTACRGQHNTKFPYGHFYEEARCNVFRATHPARVLHGDASMGHLDPRLNQVTEAGDPLLRLTGATPACRSEWNGDAVYDMVGNLDEWVDDPDGTFVGGFYSRSTREGCDARVEVHSYDYYDYSLGVRCCKPQ
jgi:formylglycine-generating enzyme required for sulfatase activity